jgi:acetolactate synthase I/III small subunit
VVANLASGAVAGRGNGAGERHTISVLVENRPGVLARVSGLFARRGFNIDSLAVCATEDPAVSRMTVVTRGDSAQLEQIVKQLDKLVDVITILDHTHDDLIEREIALIKVRATVENRGEIMQLAAVFHADVDHISPKEETMILEVTGETNDVDAFLETLAKFHIEELVRTGTIAMVRGARRT